MHIVFFKEELEKLELIITEKGMKRIEYKDAITLRQSSLTISETKEIINTCSHSGLNFYQTLSLILKHHWEAFVCINSEVPWDEIIKSRYGNVDLQDLKNKFNPDSSMIYQELENDEKRVSKSGYDRRSFDTLIQEMILADIHLAGIDSYEMQEFIKREQKSSELVQNASKEVEEEFWIVKNDWLQCHETLGELLLLTEQIRLRNANITWEFFLVFGEEYLELKTESLRYDKIKLKVELFDSLQVSTMEELEQMVAEIEANMDMELTNLRMEILLAPCLRKTEYETTIISPGELGEHHRECKKILREIWLLAHPDRLMNQKAYENLTESQQQKLKELWNKAMRIRPMEIGFQDSQFGYTYRSSLVLEEILISIRTILENAGIDTDINLIIKGETLKDQLAWIKNSIGKLDREIEMVRAEIKALIENKDIAKKSALLATSPEQQEIAKKEMQEKSLHLKNEADRLEAYLESSLSKKSTSH